MLHLNEDEFLLGPYVELFLAILLKLMWVLRKLFYIEPRPQKLILLLNFESLAIGD